MYDAAVSLPGSDVPILLADDHDIVRRGLRELLEEQPGWEVCGEAATGREALEHAIRLRPQVVVLDLMMPVLNGWEFMERYQASSTTDHAPVLVITAFKDRAAPVGVRKILPKPFSIDDLSGSIDELSRSA